MLKAFGGSVSSRGALRDCVIMIYLDPILAAEPAEQQKAPNGMGDDDARIFGAKVKELREAAGLTQVALAKKAGVQQGQLSEIEIGKRIPRLDTIKKLARALGVPPHELITD